MSTIYKSFQNLANYNGGLFKSEKQAEFLTQYANERYGCVGHLIANGNPVFVDLDEKGIVKMYYRSETKKAYKNVLIFERAVKGQLNEMQTKEIKRLERIVLKLQKEFKRHTDAFADGSYNSSGDISTYTESMIELHKRSQKQRTERLNTLEITINKIKNNN